MEIYGEIKEITGEGRFYEIEDFYITFFYIHRKHS